MLRVKELCALKGITLATLATTIGISAPSLSSAINGNPTLEMLKKIATALEVDITELFDRPQVNSFNCPKCGTPLKISIETEK